MSEVKPPIDHAVEDKIDEKIDKAKIKPSVESLDTAQNVASKTTAEQDLTTLGQRKINLIWETTQAVVAILVTAGTLGSVMIILYRGVESPLNTTAFVLISNIFFMIATFYFQRTNHTKTGGVGGTDSR